MSNPASWPNKQTNKVKKKNEEKLTSLAELRSSCVIYLKAKISKAWSSDIPVTETQTDTEMIDISKTHTETNTEKIFNTDTIYT